MKKRIGRRQLIENLRTARRQRNDAILRMEQAQNDKVDLRAQVSKWRDRLEMLENNPDLQYVGTIPGGSLVTTARIDIGTATRLKDDMKSRELIRWEMARRLAEAISEQGLMRGQYGGEVDTHSTRVDPYNTVRVIARLDVVPWDKLVRRTENRIILEPRRFYEARLVPPIYEDMARNEELARDAPAPWE